jgi:hypothetical protein
MLSVMRRNVSITVALALIALAPSLLSAQQPTPTPKGSEQHVTVPSLPDQPNREGTVQPAGGLKTDSEGYAKTKTYDGTVAPTPAPAGRRKPPAKGSGAGAAPAAPPPDTLKAGPAPTGKMVTTGANVMHTLGTVTSVQPDGSVTVKLKRTGATVTYTRAANADVPADLKAGDSVRVQVLAAEKGRVTDKIERVTKK